MVSCIEIETASLVFACLSLFFTCIASFVCIALIIHMNVLIVYLQSQKQRTVDKISELERGVSYYGLYINIGLSFSLVIEIIALIFTIILIKGLISRKAHLVKAYFIYGVTVNTISVLLAIGVTLTLNVYMGTSLIVCFLYYLILIMIKATYEKFLATDYDQFGHKKLESEKTIINVIS